jgi:hypothetical protein
MANDMVAFAASKLPAHLAGKAKTDNVFANAVSAGGFPIISIKGKVFHVQRGDDKTLVTNGVEGEPAASLEAIIVGVNPNKSKLYYDSGYEEGSVAKPTCYSNDGLAPNADAENPQAKKCAVCPHNQWGSRITDNGGKGKACGDSMRLAISPPDQLNDPMLIRVPAASLKTLGQYGAQLAKRGVEPHHVLTKIGFDYNVAHPALTFKAMRFVEADELAQVEAVLLEESETIGQITGTGNSVTPEVEHKAAEAAPKPAPAPEPAPKPAPEPVAEVAPEPAKATAKVDDYDSIDQALDNLDFDD